MTCPECGGRGIEKLDALPKLVCEVCRLMFDPGESMKLVWAEIDCCSGLAIRIFKNRKLMILAMPYMEDGCTKEMPRAEATAHIRQQLFSIQSGHCAGCNDIIFWDTMHMHEQLHRGQFQKRDVENHLEIETSGEISLANSIALCQQCHEGEHADRQVRL